MRIYFLSRTIRGLSQAIIPATLLWVPIYGQQQAPANSGTPVVASAQERANDAGDETAQQLQSQIIPKNDRLFFVLPNYATVENHEQFTAIPAKTKFRLSMKTMSDPVTISFIGVIALLGQARNSDPSYGQGLQGYGKRYGTAFADAGIGTLMTTSVFPTVLHQDPRYFQLGTGGAWHRAMYSVSRIFVTRSDGGELQFNYSEIVGNAVAAGISNAYRPHEQRTLGNTLRPRTSGPTFVARFVSKRICSAVRAH